MYTLDVLCKVNSDNRKVWAAIYNPIGPIIGIINGSWLIFFHLCIK
jgi:hypothetical protein